MPRPDCTWCEVLPRLAGRAPPASAPRPRGPAALQCVRGRAGCGGGGGAEAGAGLCGRSVGTFSSCTRSSPRPAHRPAPSVRRDPAGPGESLGGGSGRAGSGQAHTAVLCSGMRGGGGAAGGCPGAPTGCPGDPEGPGVGWRGPPCLPAQALPLLNQRLRFPQCGGWAERGVLPALGPRRRGGCAGSRAEGGVPQPASRARPGTSCPRSLPAPPLSLRGRAGGREGDAPSSPAPFIELRELLPSPAGDGQGGGDGAEASAGLFGRRDPWLGALGAA